MLKMNQPTISFISSSTGKNDEIVLETDEPEEMEKLEYSESDDEDASGDSKNIDPSPVEKINSLIINSSNTALVDNTNAELVDDTEPVISVLDRLEEQTKNSEEHLELDEKLDPSTNFNNNSTHLELATHKVNLNLEDERVEPQKNVDDNTHCDLPEDNKIIDIPEVENLSNSKKCFSPSRLIIETHVIDKMRVDSASDDVKSSKNVKSKDFIGNVDKQLDTLENEKFTEVTNETSQNTDEENIFLQTTQTFSPTNDEEKKNIILQTTQIFSLPSEGDNTIQQNTPEDNPLDETERFPVADNFDDNDSLLDEIDEAISNSEGGNTNSMMEYDTQASLADDNSKSKQDNEGTNLDADDSFGNLMIDESITQDHDISNEKCETENFDSAKNLACDQTVLENVTTIIGTITETSEAIKLTSESDDKMDGIQETDLTTNDKLIYTNVEEPMGLDIDVTEVVFEKEPKVAAPTETELIADDTKGSLINETQIDVPAIQITKVISQPTEISDIYGNLVDPDAFTEELRINGDPELDDEVNDTEKKITESSKTIDIVGKPTEGLRIKGVSELNEEATEIAKVISESIDAPSTEITIEAMEIEEHLDKAKRLDDLEVPSGNLENLNEINLLKVGQDDALVDHTVVDDTVVDSTLVGDAVVDDTVVDDSFVDDTVVDDRVVDDTVAEFQAATNNDVEEANDLALSNEIEVDETNTVGTSKDSEERETNVSAHSNEAEPLASELDNKTGNRKRLLSSEISNGIDGTIKKPRIDLNLAFDDIELVENNGADIDIPKSVNDCTYETKSNEIEDDVEMQELPEEKAEEYADDDDDDTDDDKPLSSIKSPHSQRPSIDSIEEVEDQKNKFLEISKNIDETSADISDEPAIKSVPKSLPFLKKFKRELTNFTTDELEELVLQKIVEALVCKSHISQLQDKVDKQEEVINSVRSKFNELSKLYKDLEMVHLRVLRDMDIKNEGYIVPVRITRAVGLQVTQDPKGKFTQTETTVKNLIEKNSRVTYKPIETKISPLTSVGTQPTTVLTNNSATTSTQNGGEIKKPRTVQKFTPMRPQLTPAQQLQIQKQTQQEKQLLLQQQKQKILLQKQQQQQQQQQQQTQHQQTIQQKIAQSQQNIQRQQAAMQAQQQRSPPQTSISLKNGQMIVSRPTINGLSVTTTTPSSLIIKKATIPNRVVQTQSSPTTPTTVTTPSFAVVSSTTTTTIAPISTPPKSVIDLTDEEDVKVPESHSPGKINVLNGQPPALVAIPGQKGVNKLTYVIRNPSTNNKILVQNIPQLQPNRVTLQKVPGTPNRYGMTKSEVNRLYYLTHRTRLLMRRKERHTRNKHIWNHLSPELTIAPKHISGKPAVPQLQTIPTAPPVTPSTSERTAPTTINIQRSMTHPAPLPNPPSQESDPSWKRIPPRPIVRIQNSNSGIVISWSLDSTRGGYATIESYQIYAYQETPSPPTTDSWRHVGDVKSMLLPMAVTLTHFEEGRRYYFAVRAVDEHNRVGVFSLPKTW